jgi:hypothetical protein
MIENCPDIIYGTPHICLEGVQKAMEIISQDSPCPSQTENENQLIKPEEGTQLEGRFSEVV